MKTLNPSNDLLSLYHNSHYDNYSLDLSSEIKNEIEILKLFYSFNTSSIEISKKDEKEAITNVKKAQKYLMNNFRLKKIYALCDDKESSLKVINDRSFLDRSKAYIWYLKNVNRINPLDLEVNTEDDFINVFGCTYVKFPIFESDNPTILPPYFKKIYINPNQSQTADISYIHEIVHTQMERKSLSYDNILQKELISYLLELIFVCDNCGRFKQRNEELLIVNDILKSYKKLNQSIDDNIYFYSKFLALKLFAVYYQSNRSEKIEMKTFIQQIFEGNINVDNMLEHYGININKNNTANLIRCLSI